MAKEIQLSDGRTAVVADFFGYHVEEAQAVANGDQKKMISALIAQCVTIDGNPVTMEELRLMRGKDYLSIMAEFSSENF